MAQRQHSIPTSRCCLHHREDVCTFLVHSALSKNNSTTVSSIQIFSHCEILRSSLTNFIHTLMVWLLPFKSCSCMRLKQMLTSSRDSVKPLVSVVVLNCFSVNESYIYNLTVDSFVTLSSFMLINKLRACSIELNDVHCLGVMYNLTASTVGSVHFHSVLSAHCCFQTPQFLQMSLKMSAGTLRENLFLWLQFCYSVAWSHV